MMKRFFVILLAFFSLSTGQAEPVESTKAVVCESKKTLFDWFKTNEYEEVLVWVGDSPASRTVLAVVANNQTGTWTFIEFNDKTACIIGVGDKSKVTQQKTLGKTY